jgi:transcriptional regulator with XRE-family HTH domain
MGAIDSGMPDLSRLGHELRTRRRALRIPSAELARRIGVSPTYVWLIEQSKPRKSGEPSRPREDLLRRWMAALGMDASEAQQIREFAGYFGPDFPNERDLMQGLSPRMSLRSISESGPALTQDDMARQTGAAAWSFSVSRTHPAGGASVSKLKVKAHRQEGPRGRAGRG